MATRQQVFEALNGERAYQDERWGHENVGGLPAHTHTVDEWFLYMQDYLTEGIRQCSRNGMGTPGYKAALDTIRKVTAMGVCCMEQNGAPARQGY